MNFFRAAFLILAVSALTACGPGEALVDGSDEELSDLESELALTGRFETFVGNDGQHYFHLLAGNGEKVLASEGYTTAYSARNGITSVKNNGINEARYLLREASNGTGYIVLVAGNGQIIGMSEMYPTRSNATAAIGSVAQVVRNTVAQAPAVTGTARFEIFRGLNLKYYFHARAANGQIVLQSQGYSTRSGAVAGQTTVQTNGTNPARYTVLPAADGKYYFVLKGGNGQVISHGETYASKFNAERGVTACVTLMGGEVKR
ncbi:MAG: YegP family protein [Myxococcaceae bacterium]